MQVDTLKTGLTKFIFLWVWNSSSSNVIPITNSQKILNILKLVSPWVSFQTFKWPVETLPYHCCHLLKSVCVYLDMGYLKESSVSELSGQVQLYSSVHLGFLWCVPHLAQPSASWSHGGDSYSERKSLQYIRDLLREKSSPVTYELFF